MFLPRYGFLFADYLPDFFWYEVLDLIRKLILSGVLIFFQRGTVTQVVLAMLMALGFLQAQIRLMPYAYDTANTCQMLSFNAIYLTLMGALLTKVRKAPCRPRSWANFSVL